jgi:hypothetical protein
VTLNRLLRAAAVALVLIPTTLPAPVFAGAAEARYLEGLVGTWRGAGRITGEDGGDVACRLTLRGSGERLSFNGRCSLSGGGGAQSFSGTIRYNDSRKRWESSSSGETVVGKKSGSTLTFVTSGSDARGKGTSTMTITPSSIKVQFKLESRRGKMSGSIPFTKS